MVPAVKVNVSPPICNSSTIIRLVNRGLQIITETSEVKGCLKSKVFRGHKTSSNSFFHCIDRGTLIELTHADDNWISTLKRKMGLEA